jgi:hypothetical protein
MTLTLGFTPPSMVILILVDVINVEIVLLEISTELWPFRFILSSMIAIIGIFVTLVVRASGSNGCLLSVACTACVFIYVVVSRCFSLAAGRRYHRVISLIIFLTSFLTAVLGLILFLFLLRLLLWLRFNRPLVVQIAYFIHRVLDSVEDEEQLDSECEY